MRIKSVKITNGLQHRSLESEFTDFNVIIGPNGCGKSSVIELLGLLLTNKFTWPGTMDTVVTQGEEKGEVKAVIEAEGDEVELSMALGRTSRKLVRGDLKISKSNEVVEYIESALLRTPIELVNEASIVRQGKLDAGLFTTQSKRQQIFQRLAGLNDIETKRKQLAEAKALCTPFMLSFDLDEKRRQVQELVERNMKLKSEHAALSSINPSQERYDQCKVLLSNLDNLVKYSTDQTALTAEHHQLEPIVIQAAAQLEIARASLLSLTATMEDRRTDYDEALRVISTAEAVAKRVAEKARLGKKLEETSATLAGIEAVPDEFVDEAKIKEFDDIYSDACNEVKQAVRVRDNLSAEDKRCPTCKTELEDPSAIIAENVAIIEEMTAIGKMASQSKLDLNIKRTAWSKKLTDYRTRLAELQTTVKNTQEALAGMDDVAETAADTSAAKAVVSDFTVLSSSVKGEQDNVDSISEVHVDANSKLQICDTKLSAVLDNLAGLGNVESTSGNVSEARTYIEAFDEHKTKMSSLAGQLTEVASQSEKAMEGLHETEAKAEKAEKLKVFSDHIEFARSALHRDNFPAGKIKSFIDRALINAEVYLEAMQAGFTASYDNEKGFIAHFPAKGTTIRADRLSGGEKTIFSLAFRFAVNEIKSETGFLFLDEPTAHLDSEHVDSVVRVLGLVKKKLAGRVQLFVVTHDEKMAAVADTVLEVNNASK